MIIRWMKRLKMMRISKYAIIITLLLSIVFCGFTIYGAHTGNFTIYMHAADVSIAAYMLEDKSDMSTRITVPALDRMDNTTYGDLAAPYYRNKIVEGLGSKNDEAHQQYLAFSFMLINLSDRMVDYDIEITVVEAKAGREGGNVLAAVRLMVFTDDDFDGATIYAMPEANEEDYAPLKENTDYTTTDFISSVQIMNQTVYGFDEGAETKYTVVMWLEGWDVDCVNDVMGGRVKMRMDFTAR